MKAYQTIKAWVKKEGNENFDVLMGYFDGVVEVCELVGSFVLQQLSQLLEHYSAGFYRHDGLAILKRLSGPEVERVKKKIMKVFKDCRLKITIKADLHILNFLDITLIYVITSMSHIGNQTIILYTLTKTLTIQKLF